MRKSKKTEFKSSDRAYNLLVQMRDAICRLKEWNAGIDNADEYYSSPEGMKILAASCMPLEAIGESVKQIDKITGGTLLPKRPDIPWNDVIGICNHIAHGYFDIDGDMVLDVVKNDLDSLQEAVGYFITLKAENCQN